ncbi:zinc finger BED domain-containing protein RICESLEEPER 1-like [Apium graveolens]|uniref:zinc finger BED domain-containing protein RICESLEEPER 1-like n=1 Tax=Apium graveolens TaxID=4045 RepID=UPI003D7B2515
MGKRKHKISPRHDITRFFPRSTARNNDSDRDVNKVYQAMAKFVCEAEKVSFSAVGSLIMETDPSFPFCYHELEHSCLKFYQKEKAKVMQTLENLDGLIALSMDIFRKVTSNSHCPEMPEETIADSLCLRAHFIDDNWEPKSWVLYYADTDHICEHGTYNTIAKCLLDLRIENKISTITPGDRENYSDEIEAIKDHLKEKKKLQIKCQPFQIYCCADLLGELVEAAFAKIGDVFKKIWTKTFPYWIIRFSKLQEAIMAEAEGEFSKQIGQIFFYLPTEDEWAKLKYICRLVEYMYDSAEVLFMTKNPTASLYLHNLRELQARLIRKESTSPDRLSIATYLLKKFDKYWDDMLLVLAIATVMDPRCKMKYIEFSSMKYEDKSGNSQVKAVLEATQGIYDDYKMHSIEAQNSLNPSGSSPSASVSSNSDSEELFSNLEELPGHTHESLHNCNFGFNCLDEYNEFLKPSKQTPLSDLELYLDEPVLPWNKDFDLMSWWRTESPKYPVLSKMARDLLAIPFSVASSNEAYRYEDFRRADRGLEFLGPVLVNALVCTRSYLQKP